MDSEVSVQTRDQHEAYIREATKVLNEIYVHFRDTLDPTMFQDALRLALDIRKSADQCPHRSCRMANACQTRVKDGEPLNCGAGIPEDTLILAAQLAVFAHTAWFERWWARMTGDRKKS